MVVMCDTTVREPFSSVPAIEFPFQRLRVWAKEGETAIRRRRALKRVDGELEKGNFKAATSLVKQLKAHPAGLLRGFGVASPKILNYRSLKELKLMGETEISSLQLVVVAILSSIKCSLEFQLHEEQIKVSVEDFGPAMDVESLHKDHLMCMHHEAGHFLVGYMLGVLPRRYKIPSVEDLLQDRFARGKVEFVGFEFLRDVGALSMSNRNLSEGKPNKEQSHKHQSLSSWVNLVGWITKTNSAINVKTNFKFGYVLRDLRITAS